MEFMTSANSIKLPRLFVDNELEKNGSFTVESAQAHYLRNVMRRKDGDRVRFFNGRDGEWFGVLRLGNREITAEIHEMLAPQPPAPPETRLLFAPLKKDPLAFLVEKSVELGATFLQPVLTQHTEVRDLNLEKARRHIIEAAEQCERLDVPQIAAPLPLRQAMRETAALMPVYACIERAGANPVAAAVTPGPAAFLIGPEGGFDAAEKEWLMGGEARIVPVSLGPRVLRAETAACYALAACAVARGE
jgi:16S rRNA (uracil1498-N3)-methyltransferase